MFEMFLDLINFTQLEMLGFKQEYITYIFLLFSILGTYYIMKPIVMFMRNKGYTFVLTYLISSLVFVGTVSILVKAEQDPFLLKSTLQAVTLFGCFLSIFLMYKFLKTKF